MRFVPVVSQRFDAVQQGNQLLSGLLVPVTLRLEDFIQAVQSQLDNAQAAMALKARNANLPLTFAIKDINLDLRAHVEFSDSEIRIRPAGAGEGEASVFHLVFTTITRPATLSHE